MPRRVRSRRNLTIFIRRPHLPSRLRPFARGSPVRDHRTGSVVDQPPRRRLKPVPVVRPHSGAKSGGAGGSPGTPTGGPRARPDAHGPRRCRSSPDFLGRRVGSPRRGGCGRARNLLGLAAPVAVPFAGPGPGRGAELELGVRGEGVHLHHREPFEPRAAGRGDRDADAARRPGGGLTDYPRSRDRDRRHAAQRRRRDRRCRNRYDFRDGWRDDRARRAVRPKSSACRSSRLARARGTVKNAGWPAAAGGLGRRTRLTGGRARSTPGSTSRPTTTTASARPAARPGRPQAAPMRGSVVNRCAVAGAPWRTRRPPLL